MLTFRGVYGVVSIHIAGRKPFAPVAVPLRTEPFVKTLEDEDEDEEPGDRSHQVRAVSPVSVATLCASVVPIYLVTSVMLSGNTTSSFGVPLARAPA